MPVDSELEAFVLWVIWPVNIIRKLQPYDRLSINGSVYVGVLLQQIALEVTVENVRHKNALSFCDNTAAVAWVCRMALKSSRIEGAPCKRVGSAHTPAAHVPSRGALDRGELE